MKTLLLLMVFYSSNFLYSFDLPIMVEIRTELKNEKIPSDFLDGVEEKLTSKGYGLVNKKMQELALKEQAKQRNSDCYDDECLVDTGKMLAAKAIILIDVGKQEGNTRRFTAKYIDLETGITTKTTTKYYNYSFDRNKGELFIFGKDLIYYLFKKNKLNKEYYKLKQEDSRWSCNFSISHGNNLYWN